MGNLYGALYVFRVLLKPSLLLPRLVIKDIRDLDFQCLRNKGFTGLVFDKDNCLTKPHADSLPAELENAWSRALAAFPSSIVIVSNSAGTRDDASLVAAQAVSRSLRVPVLIHGRKKPACAHEVVNHFRAPLRDITSAVWPKSYPESFTPPGKHKILVVGDRSMTDTVLANLINSPDFTAVPVLTQRLWATEGLGTAFMRFLEGASRKAVEYSSRRWHVPKPRAKDDLDDCSIRPAPVVRRSRFSSLSSITNLMRLKLPALGSRSIWTSSTIYRSSPEELVQEAEKRLSSLTQDSSIMFGLSKNLPPQQLGTLVQHLQKTPCTASIGCLTDTAYPDTFSLALAIWTPEEGKQIVAFRSEIKGKPRISLGREVKPEVQEERDSLDQAISEGPKDWSAMFGANAAGARNDVALPKALRNIDPEKIGRIWYFTDDAPEGLMEALDKSLPNCSNYGMLASSTPFVTGRRMTLLQGESIHSDGAVGFALVTQGHASHAPKVQAEYPGWEPLGKPYEITDAQGNIILTLGDQPAARILLELAQSQAKSKGSQVRKETEYFVGLVQATSKSKPCPPGQASSLSRVTSGDPSRGAMAVDTEASFASGDYLQFFHQVGCESASTLAIPKYSSAVICMTSPSSAMQIEEAFQIASEHGSIISPGAGQKSWVCSLPGSITYNTL